MIRLFNFLSKVQISYPDTVLYADCKLGYTYSYYIPEELRDEVALLINGEQVYKMPTLKERRDYCSGEMKTIYPEIRRIINPHEYYVDLSEKLLSLKNKLIHQYTGK